MIQTPYLLFLGDAPDPLAAKVAQGIRDWRPEHAVAQYGIPCATVAASGSGASPRNNRYGV